MKRNDPLVISLVALGHATSHFMQLVLPPLSRDLIVRAATPGATGRVYGFVYSGLDVGSFATPVFYGWLMDHSLPHGVFYTIFGFTLLAMFTVLQLPGRRSAAIQRI